MRYWIYENWGHKSVRIHRSDCLQCNDGRGKLDTNNSKTGRWLGPFASLAAATEAMQGIDEPDRGRCFFCGVPQSN